MKINTIQKRTGYFSSITSDFAISAGAGMIRISQITAGAGIHGGNKNKISRIGKGCINPRNMDFPVLQRLPKHLQHRTRKFRKFIQEKYTPVRQSHFARAGNGSAANESCHRDRMMRASERSLSLIISCALKSPATLYIFVTSSASSLVIGGRMVVMRRASIVLPDPGGPVISTLWAPAAAISMAEHRRRLR